MQLRSQGEDQRRWPGACAHHPDGFWIGLSGGGGGGWLYFWKDVPMGADDRTEFFKFKLPDTGRDLDLHPDNLRLAVAHADGNLRLYHLHKKA